MIRKITHRTDYLMTQEEALTPLKENSLEVTWFTNSSNKESVLHTHPYYCELVLPINGEVLYSVDGSLYHLHTGELIIFPTGVYHSGRYDVASSVSERMVTKIGNHLWQKAVETAGLTEAPWLHQATIVDADAVAYWDMRRLFERMSYTADIHPEHKEAVFLSQTVECLCIIDQVVRKHHVRAPSASGKQVVKALEYIHSHYLDPNLNVAKICEVTYTSRGYLSRIFKEYTMESIYNYITILRMQYCRQILGDKDKSILDACTESGFSEYTSFLKSFRRLYGISPSQYKKQLLHTAEEMSM